MSQVIFLEKKFNSESHTKNVQYFESYQRKKVESSESYWRISLLLNRIQKKSSMWKKKSYSKKKSSILWVVLKKKNQFCESYSYFKIKYILRVIVQKMGSILWVIYWEKSLSRIEKKKRFSSLYRIFGKSSILWVVFFFKKKTQKFNSLTHTQKNSIHGVILPKKRVQFFEYFKKSSILWVFFLTHGSIVWVIFIKRKRLNSLSQCFLQKIYSASPIQKNSVSFFFFFFNTLLGVIHIREIKVRFLANSLRHIKKRVQFFASCSRNFNSLSHFFFKKKIEFFESC